MYIPSPNLTYWISLLRWIVVGDLHFNTFWVILRQANLGLFLEECCSTFCPFCLISNLAMTEPVFVGSKAYAIWDILFMKNNMNLQIKKWHCDLERAYAETLLASQLKRKTLLCYTIMLEFFMITNYFRENPLLWHELGVLQFNSILRRKWSYIYDPHPLQTSIASSSHLCLSNWMTIDQPL